MIGSGLIMSGWVCNMLMKNAWKKQKAELEELNRELSQMEDITEELKKQKEEIERLLSNEFLDYSALFKQKKNI